MTCRRSIIRLSKRNAEKEFLPLNNYGGQRPLCDAWVRELVIKLEDGRFGAAQIATCRFGEEKYLINGQHCVHMAMLTDCEVDCFLEEWEVQSREEIALRFSQYDGNRVRSARQIANVYAFESGQSWPKGVPGLCASAIAFSKYGEQYAAKMKKDERGHLLLAHTDTVNAVSNLLFGENRERFLLRVPVVAAIIKNLILSNDGTEDFWSGVRDGDNLPKGGPQIKLRDYLKDSQRNARGSASAREIHVKCIHAWNAWRRKTSTDLKYHSDCAIPKAI